MASLFYGWSENKQTNKQTKVIHEDVEELQNTLKCFGLDSVCDFFFLQKKNRQKDTHTNTRMTKEELTTLVS